MFLFENLILLASKEYLDISHLLFNLFTWKAVRSEIGWLVDFILPFYFHCNVRSGCFLFILWLSMMAWWVHGCITDVYPCASASQCMWSKREGEREVKIQSMKVAKYPFALFCEVLLEMKVKEYRLANYHLKIWQPITFNMVFWLGLGLVGLVYFMLLSYIFSIFFLLFLLLCLYQVPNLQLSSCFCFQCRWLYHFKILTRYVLSFYIMFPSLVLEWLEMLICLRKSGRFR